jgi:hypothetical protein
MAAIDRNRWTVKTQEAFHAAVDDARDRANPEVTPDHLLAVLLSQPDGVVLPLLQKAGVQPATATRQVRDRLDQLPAAYGGAEPTMSSALRTGSTRPTPNAASSATTTSPPSACCSPWPNASISPARYLPRSVAGAGQPPGHQPEPRGHRPGPRALRSRPHRGRPDRPSCRTPGTAPSSGSLDRGSSGTNESSRSRIPRRLRRLRALIDERIPEGRMQRQVDLARTSRPKVIASISIPARWDGPMMTEADSAR